MIVHCEEKVGHPEKHVWATKYVTRKLAIQKFPENNDKDGEVLNQHVIVSGLL